jgi:hypothetical protein
MYIESIVNLLLISKFLYGFQVGLFLFFLNTYKKISSFIFYFKLLFFQIIQIQLKIIFKNIILIIFLKNI